MIYPCSREIKIIVKDALNGFEIYACCDVKSPAGMTNKQLWYHLL